MAIEQSAKQDELYSLHASSSSFKWVLECLANHRDFADSTASTSLLGKATKAVSGVPRCPRRMAHVFPHLFIHVYIIFSTELQFKLQTIQNYFDELISVEQQFYVKNLCQNFFSLHKSRQFLLQRSIVQCWACQETWKCTTPFPPLKKKRNTPLEPQSTYISPIVSLFLPLSSCSFSFYL